MLDPCRQTLHLAVLSFRLLLGPCVSSSPLPGLAPQGNLYSLASLFTLPLLSHCLLCPWRACFQIDEWTLQVNVAIWYEDEQLGQIGGRGLFLFCFPFLCLYWLYLPCICQVPESISGDHKTNWPAYSQVDSVPSWMNCLHVPMYNWFHRTVPDSWLPCF